VKSVVIEAFLFCRALEARLIACAANYGLSELGELAGHDQWRPFADLRTWLRHSETGIRVTALLFSNYKSSPSGVCSLIICFANLDVYSFAPGANFEI
jgi:hypothetical protein